MNTGFTPFNILPDEDIVRICEQMSIDELQNFVISSARHHNICQEILEDRIIAFEEEQKRLRRRRNPIMERLSNLSPGMVLDASRMTPTGLNIKTIKTPMGISKLRKVPGYDVYVLPEQIAEMQSFLSNQ